MSLRLRLRSSSAGWPFAGALGTIALVAACGGKSSDTSPAGGETSDAGVTPEEAGATDGGATEAGAGEAGPINPTDGAPTYTSQCTPLSQQTGTAIDTKHGRLDGYLAYVVPKDGPASCNGDDSHVHLQIRVSGLIYDVAVDIGTFTGDSNLYEADMPLPAGAWAEGWHDDGLSYTQLGLHSTQFTPEDPTTLAQHIQAVLAGVNHVSIFGDGYPTENGCHDVHYENGTADGALVIEPLSPMAHILFFRFSTQTF